MNAFVEIINADGSTQRHFIGAEQAILGSSPSVQISLPSATELEPEHLLISPQKDGCWVSVASGARTPVLVRGQRFEQGVLKYGTEVAVGNLRIHVDRSDPKGAQGTSAGTKLLMILALPVLYWLFVTDVEHTLPEMTSAKPPKLFKAVAACTADTAEDAVVEAADAADAALAKAERYPFDNRDGITAVNFFGVAENCYKIAGMMREAEIMRQDREVLQLRIEEHYRTHLLALERYLKSGRVKSALEEARALQHLLGNRNDRYTEWLASTEKKLSLKHSKAEQEK